MLTREDIIKTMENLSEPFSCEADFQQEFAIERIRMKISAILQQDKLNNDEKIKLIEAIKFNEIICEYPIKNNLVSDKIDYIDIFEDDTFIELKYKTRADIIKRSGQKIQLKNQGAQDISQILFLRDIARLEKAGKKGFAVFLTNDESFKSRFHPFTEYKPERNESTKKEWIKAGRFKLKKDYDTKWIPYNTRENYKHNFYYCIVEVN